MAAPTTGVTTAPLTVLCSPDGSPQQPAFIPASHPLALSTPFLEWTAAPAGGTGGIALVSLTSGQMLAAFGARLYGSKSPADFVAVDKVNPLTIGLTGAAWSRVLNEYIDSGLLAVSLASRTELATRLRSISICDPQKLCIHSHDWLLGEDTAGTPGVPGVAAVPATAPTPAIGRRGQRGYRPANPGNPAIPAVPAVAGTATLDPALLFLTLTHLFELECEGVAPWSAIAFLAGALGPVHTQSERNRPGSQAQFVARALAAGAHRHYGTSAGDDHSLASNLRDYLLVLAHALPSEFLSPGVALLPLRAEFRDAIVYARDADGRRSIEEARIFTFGPSNPTLRDYVFNRVSSGAEAYNLVLMGIRGLLPRYDATYTPLRELIPLLEAALYSKQAVLAMAATAPGATAASIMAEIIRQTQVLRGATGGASSAGASSAVGASTTQGHVADAYEEALTGEAFIKFKTAMADADLLSTAGRRAAFEAATEGDCVLPIRLLLAGESTLAKRDAALGALMGLRPFLSEWFTYVAVVDAKGAVHPGLTRWCITMPGYKSLVSAMNGLMRLYVEYHGPHSLAPRRAEPMKFAMMRAIYSIPPGTTVGRWVWTDANHDIFMFRRLNVFLMHTAFRLGEIVHTAVVVFPLARAPSGAPFAPVRVQRNMLERLCATDAA